MKIALITDSFFSYDIDPAAHVGILAEGLGRIGHKAIVLVPEEELREPITEGRAIRFSGKAYPNEAGVQLSRKGMRQMEEKLLAFQPDLIHIHSLSETGAFALHFSQEQQIPALLTVHSIEELKKGGGSLPGAMFWKKRKRLQTAEAILENAVNITCLSHAMTQAVKQLGYRVNQPVFPSAIDTEIFNHSAGDSSLKRSLSQSFSLQGKTTFVCSCQDADSLFPFLEEWSHAFSDADPIRLLIIDHGNQSDELLSMLHTLGLSKRASLTGRLSREEKAACFQLSSCFILCSRSERFQLEAIEAAACGTPILVQAQSGTAQIVDSGKNGFLWDSYRDLFELVKKFSKLTGPGKEALTRLVSGTVRTLTPQNQARAAEALYHTML